MCLEWGKGSNITLTCEGLLIENAFDIVIVSLLFLLFIEAILGSLQVAFQLLRAFV